MTFWLVCFWSMSSQQSAYLLCISSVLPAGLCPSSVLYIHNAGIIIIIAGVYVVCVFSLDGLQAAAADADPAERLSPSHLHVHPSLCWLFSCLSFLISSLALLDLQLSADVILIAIHSHPPFLFDSRYQCYHCFSFHIWCHIEGNLTEAEMI